MPIVVDVSQEKADLSRLLAEVERGEEVLIARNGEPVAKLVAVAPRGRRTFGALHGRVSLDDRFFEPLPPEELAAWERCADAVPQRPPDSGAGGPRSAAPAGRQGPGSALRRAP